MKRDALTRRNGLVAPRPKPKARVRVRRRPAAEVAVPFTAHAWGLLFVAGPYAGRYYGNATARSDRPGLVVRTAIWGTRALAESYLASARDYRPGEHADLEVVPITIRITHGHTGADSLRALPEAP